METVESIVEANTRLGVPIESQYIDIDYMERAMGFTIGEAFEGKILNNLYNQIKTDVSKQRWFSGRILACHAGGPGSIPGRCKLLVFREVSTLFLSER